MYESLNQRLQKISDSGNEACLAGSLIGLEKECLRVATSGGLSRTPHPVSLGSALTNPYITTDFSEALLELITPPCASIEAALEFLDEVQRYVYSKLDDEILWVTSMPCVVESGDCIPIARYGNSNAGMMKTVYRRGLGYRYGRTMQVIAGVHFNYSFSDEFWALYQQLEDNTDSLLTFSSDRYMGLVRNMLRHGWLIPYLFGASPAVCKSFLHGKRTMFPDFNENTYYEPYATSLRMGDIGYTNSKEDIAGIKADYNSVNDYVRSLQHATETPFEAYKEIGVKVDGEYRQLNDSVLQIENEYYATVRPKQIVHGNEKPASALKNRGIAYIEIRSLDVSAFDPLGVNREQLYFLETFLLFCLLHDSPELTKPDLTEIDMNLVQVAHAGRQPDLMLSCHDKPIALKEWALNLGEAMLPVAKILDRVNNCSDYTSSLQTQVARINDPSLTPSARMLDEMRKHEEGFFHYANRMSLKHMEYFKSRQLPVDRQKFFESIAKESLEKQKQIEAADNIDFDEFLRRYFAQDV